MWQYNYGLYPDEIKGQKWGVRRYQNKDGTLTAAGKKRQDTYRSTSIRSAIARHSNKKVDDSFRKWDENTKKRDTAIDLGKKRNQARLDYELNKNDKSLKSEYKRSDKAYKKALRSNTTYRKGVVRKEVEKDASRKYLSQAKKIKKELEKDPYNKQLKRTYRELMNKHDIERANARRAVDVSTKRMYKVRSLKSATTKTVKTVATAATVAIGMEAVRKYANLNINSEQVINWIKAAKKFSSFIY